MGSGCNSSKSKSGCTGDNVTSSHCVVWQGDAYENLGICTGDSITEVGEVVLNKLLEFAKGEGISLSDITTDCDELNVKLKNTDQSLYQIVKLALTESCSLWDTISQLRASFEDGKITVDASSLCPDASTISEIQQCMVDSIVTLKSSMDKLKSIFGDFGDNTSVSNTINNWIGDFLKTSVNSCNGGIQKTGSGKNTTLDFVGIVPPGGYIWGEFDISKFDSTGKGTGLYCGYALANGKNGTIDMRNRIPSMASKIGGVDRTFIELTDIGVIKGADQITLRSNQIPNHEHETIEEPHSHWFTSQGGTKQVGRNSGGGESAGATNANQGVTGLTTTNLKVAGVKGAYGQPIDIRQNTVYQVWIKRISGFSAVNSNQNISVDPGGGNTGIFDK